MTTDQFKEEAPMCEWQETHPQAIERVKTTLPEEDTMLDVSELFKVLGDSTRCRILFVLLVSEMCDVGHFLSDGMPGQGNYR